MSVKQVSASRITCDHDSECAAQVHGPLLATGSEIHSGDITRSEAEVIRALARDRGWSTDGRDLCPSHRGASS